MTEKQKGGPDICTLIATQNDDKKATELADIRTQRKCPIIRNRTKAAAVAAAESRTPKIKNCK